jgi:hypothetical protein
MLYNELIPSFQICEALCTFFEELCIALEQQQKYTLKNVKQFGWRFNSENSLLCS